MVNGSSFNNKKKTLLGTFPKKAPHCFKVLWMGMLLGSRWNLFLNVQPSFIRFYGLLMVLVFYMDSTLTLLS